MYSRDLICNAWLSRAVLYLFAYIVFACLLEAFDAVDGDRWIIDIDQSLLFSGPSPG